MAFEGPKLPEQAPESGLGKHEADRKLLQVETRSDAINNLNGAIKNAGERYADRPYCANILSAYIEKQKLELQRPGINFAEIYRETTAAIARFHTVMEQFLRNPIQLKEKIIKELDINPETKNRMQNSSIEAARFVEAAMTAGESNPERLAVLALLSLVLREASPERTADARVYQERFFNKMEMTGFLSLLESFQ